MNIVDEDLRHRAQRLIAGDFRTGDLDRLFLGQRDRAWNQASFREVSDFVAHRDTREKGLLTQVSRDVFASVDVWSLKMRGRDPTWADIARAAYANLRLATDSQLKSGCRCQRSIAKKRLQSALARIGRKESLTNQELRVLDYLGNRFIWRAAFTSDQLFSEFKHVLTRNGIITKRQVAALESAKAFISLYALTIMHGTRIVLEDGRKARLFAGYANRERFLEVKVEIVFNDLGKPLMTPICLFLTDLRPDNHCHPTLVSTIAPILVDHWNFPIDVGADNRLTRIS